MIRTRHVRIIDYTFPFGNLDQKNYFQLRIFSWQHTKEFCREMSSAMNQNGYLSVYFKSHKGLFPLSFHENK